MSEQQILRGSRRAFLSNAVTSIGAMLLCPLSSMARAAASEGDSERAKNIDEVALTGYRSQYERIKKAFGEAFYDGYKDSATGNVVRGKDGVMLLMMDMPATVFDADARGLLLSRESDQIKAELYNRNYQSWYEASAAVMLAGCRPVYGNGLFLPESLTQISAKIEPIDKIARRVMGLE